MASASKFVEIAPFVPRAQWSNDPASSYARECFAHLGKIAGEPMFPRELTDDALVEAIVGMRAQRDGIVAENKAARITALAEAKEANAALAGALAAARAALAPHLDEDMPSVEIGDSEPALSLARRADDLLSQAQRQHAEESARPAFIGATTQSLDVCLAHCRAEQTRRADKQKAADEATRASLRRLGVEV